MPWPRGLRALAHRDYRIFFAAQFVGLVGSWMQSVAQAWLVLQLTDSPLRLGLLSALQFGPVLLFSVVTGVVADRLPKRRLLVATQLVLAALALALAGLTATDVVRYWHVAVLAALAGLANAVDMPTRQAFVIELVGKDDVVNAVALNSAAFNAARVVGPAAAGLLIASVGVAPAFALNGTGFVVVAAGLLRLRTDGRPSGRAGTTMVQEIAEGVRYAARTPRIVAILGILFVVSLCVFNFAVYVPLLARHVLRLGPEGFGFLMAALGVGAVAGALTLAMRGSRLPSVASVFVAAAIATAGLVALALVRDFWMAVIVLVVTGFSGIVAVAAGNTSLQLTAPDELRGRVMSLFTLVYGGVFPIGAAIVGAISEAWSVTVALLAAGLGGLAALAALAAWWWLGRHR
jgi:predicted MFS family arabinose efflux permease